MIKILCITSLKFIPDVQKKLEELGQVDFIENPDLNSVKEVISKYDVLFTNPNNSKVFLGKEVLENSNLKCITTASTGTIHIDMDYAKKKNINIINLSKEIDVLERITSTAEHAFLLMLSGIRNIFPAVSSVTKKNWDYEPFVGRQLTSLEIGVMGYGRLGKMFANYSKAFSANVRIYDPFVKCEDYPQYRNLKDFLNNLDVLSLHIHASKENLEIINKDFLSNCKNGLLIVNTSRGEIVNESDLLSYLNKNNKSKYFTDVLSSETKGLSNNKLLEKSLKDDSIVITPHMGGMTIDAQKIAYAHAVRLLKDYVRKEFK